MLSAKWSFFTGVMQIKLIFKKKVLQFYGFVQVTEPLVPRTISLENGRG